MLLIEMFDGNCYRVVTDDILMFRMDVIANAMLIFDSTRLKFHKFRFPEADWVYMHKILKIIQSSPIVSISDMNRLYNKYPI